MATIIGWVNAFFTNIITAFGWILDGVMWVLKTVLYVVLDGLLVVIVAFVNVMDFSQVIGSHAMDWGGVPSQLIYCINQCGVPQGLAMILSAILIRMILNLIPAAFTRI